jgi:hypothetical protein
MMHRNPTKSSTGYDGNEYARWNVQRVRPVWWKPDTGNPLNILPELPTERRSKAGK